MLSLLHNSYKWNLSGPIELWETLPSNKQSGREGGVPQGPRQMLGFRSALGDSSQGVQDGSGLDEVFGIKGRLTGDKYMK
ncbi:hypothetical protein PBY51_009258 [Eleginops maclovinus]|uniref:Uncharacterized protein n=1 Tax=Eleginops maclovinus TaxID=56733 RepID=A0AAN7XY81_ELEMC|nr:hypothetical protein PBY51_009258 [Eleginops maclovinus]